MHNLSGIWSSVTSSLFPALEAAGRPLAGSHIELVMMLELINFEAYAPPNLLGSSPGLGRKQIDRRLLMRAFAVKMYLNLPTTKALQQRLKVDADLRLICGWKLAAHVPSEATFSRAFSQLAAGDLLNAIHAALLAKVISPDEAIVQVNRDATDIQARERPLLKEKAAATTPYPVGRPKQTEPPRPKPESRLVAQMTQTAEESLKAIPTHCDIGCKKNSHAHSQHWIGYKAHVDVSETGLPLLLVLSSASVHDSQLAIPMMKLTATRVRSRYQVMDAGYDSNLIHDYIVVLKQTAVIPASHRRKDPTVMSEEDKAIYHGRSAIERFNSDLKDNHGGRNVRVRGHAKVLCHLMFGVLVIFAKTVCRQNC